MKVRLICDWNGYFSGQEIEVQEQTGLELIRREYATNAENGLRFVVDEGYWKTKDAIWITIKENGF